MEALSGSGQAVRQRDPVQSRDRTVAIETDLFILPKRLKRTRLLHCAKRPLIQGAYFAATCLDQR